VDILTVGVDALGFAPAVAQCLGFVAAGGAHHVVTVNPEFIMTARRRPDFHRVLNEADLALADAVGIVWASRLLRRPVPERVTGADLMPALADALGAAGRTVFLLGGAPGVAAAAGAALEATTRARIAGVHAGSPADADAPAIVRAVRDADPAALFVAFGSPAQDLWIDRHRAELQVPVMMGVGGAVDFLAGVQRRAPRVVRRLGFEWLWRLVREPWRWRRQLALPAFAAAVLRERVRGGL
jgi:N-acetylglucosaminyldiphosphoundecaprenol N-acetyl-beta-D-mannosaminyltransferase